MSEHIRRPPPVAQKIVASQDTPTLDGQESLSAQVEEIEAVAENPTPMLDAAAAEVPPEDPEQIARDIFSELDDAVGIGLFNRADGEAAEALLAGRSPAEITAIRAEYEARTGRRLEDDVGEQFGGEGNLMMATLLNTMSLDEKLEHFDTSKSMENLLEHATDEELAALVTNEDGSADRSVLDTLRSKMSEDAYLDARIRLFPAERQAAVIERIQQANNIGDDNEGAAMAAFSKLAPAERQAVLDANPDLISFMSYHERIRMRSMADSERGALDARMAQATIGAGTDDEALPGIIEDAARIRQQQQQLQQELEQVDLPDERRAELESELASMGDLSLVFTPQRNDDGTLDETSFLGRLAGDVQPAELAAHMRQMGFSAQEVSKQVVLDAMAKLNDDEQGVREAFAAIPAEQRQALWDDPHVQQALTGLTGDELLEVQAFRDDDRLAMASQRVGDANGIFGQDEAKALEAVIGLDEADRKSFMGSDLFRYTRGRMDPEEQAALDEVVQTGALTLETGMAAAAGGEWDGTNQDLMQLASAQRTGDDAVEIRLGYVLASQGATPSTPEEEQALARYNQIRLTFESELDGDDVQVQMDALVSHAGDSEKQESATAGGRMVGSTLIDQRADEKMGPDGDGGGGFADFFTDTDDTALQSHQSQKASHLAAVADGEVDQSELSMHAALGETFGEDYQAMLDAQNAITDTAAATASAAAMIAATLASGGALGPAAIAFMAQYGTAATTIGATLASVGTKELFGGDRYQATGADGATDVALAAVAAGSTQLTGKISGNLVEKLSSVIPGVQAPAITNAGAMGQGLMGVAQRLPTVALNATVDSTLGIATGALQDNVFSEGFWNKDLGGMATSLGDSAVDQVQGLPAGLLQSVLIDSATGAIDARAVRNMAAQLQADGIDTSNLTMQQVQDLTVERYNQSKQVQPLPTRPGPAPDGNVSPDVGDELAQDLVPLAENGAVVTGKSEEIPLSDNPSMLDEHALDYAKVPGAEAFLQGRGDEAAIDPNDVGQGQIGDCYLMACIASVARADPKAIQDAIQPREDGNFDVTVHVRNEAGELVPKTYTVDAQVPMLNDGLAYAQLGDRTAAGNEMWPSLLEKAAAIHTEGYEGIQGSKVGSTPDVYNTYEFFTGRKGNEARIDEVSDVMRGIQNSLDWGVPLSVGSIAHGEGTDLAAAQASTGVVPNHAYAPVSVDFENNVVHLQNPWGSDHATLGFDDFQTHFETLSYGSKRPDEPVE